MGFNVENKGRFLNTSLMTVSILFRVKGTLAGKDVTISIAPCERNNYISAEFANHLVIPESNISERLDFWDRKQFEISGLELNVGDYMVISQFTVSSLWSSSGDIVLGLPWIKTLGTFILNAEKKFLTFSYKQKRITFQDITIKSDLEAPTSKDFKDISKMISQGNQKSDQKMQSEFDKIVTDKEEEISRLRDHNQKLLLQIKKTKDKAQQNQKLEEENRDLQKKLLENIDENCHLKKHKQDLMDQIQKLKDDKKVQEEMTRNLKKEKDSLDNKLEQIQKRTSKPLDSKIYVEKKEANTNSVLVTVQKEDNLVKKQTTITPYRHPNHINQYPKKWELSKDNGTNVLKAPDNRSIENPNSQQQINFGWIDPSTYQKLCSTLRSSYQHVSSATTSQGTVLQCYKALRTKPF